MNPKIYLALYKGRRDGHGVRVWWHRLADFAVRKITRSPYSHCEIALIGIYGQTRDSNVYRCYSSSIRDGGVRCKVMPLPSDKWDLIEIPTDQAAAIEARLHAFYGHTKGQGYDLPGALGVVLPVQHRLDKWFCSEWCGRVLGLTDTHQLSPGKLARLLQSAEPQPKAV